MGGAGAPGWCQHPALGGNQEKRGHGCGPAPHHGSSVSGESLLDTTQILACEAWHMAEAHQAHPFCVSDDKLCQQLAMAGDNIVLEIMSLGAEIDHDPGIEWWQHPIRHKYSSLMCSSALSAGLLVIMHCVVREIAGRLVTAKSERERQTHGHPVQWLRDWLGIVKHKHWKQNQDQGDLEGGRNFLCLHWSSFFLPS